MVTSNMADFALIGRELDFRYEAPWPALAEERK